MLDAGAGCLTGTPTPSGHSSPCAPFEDLVDAGIVDSSKAGLARKRDGLINYMYLPENDELELPESMAFLYMPVTLHHTFLGWPVVDSRDRVAAAPGSQADS